MRSRWIGALMVALAGVAAAEPPGPEAALESDRPLRFFAVGDAPYGDAEYAPFTRLLQQVGERAPPFIVHVGDIKGGGQPCSDARNRRVADLFAAQPVPVLYTPGDNEWTDCHRRAAGARDPLERLQALRERFFADPSVLHNEPLGLVVPNRDYPENGYFVYQDVVFVLLHVVGSDNNHRQGHAEALQEWRRRSAANRALLDQATGVAGARGARAMVLFFHANPLLEQSPPSAGFRPFIDDLERLLDRYSGPVLAVHGDTHRFQFNRPWQRSGTVATAGERFWRLEVPGSPFLGGVWITLTDDVARPFLIEVVYPRADEAFQNGG